MTITDLGSLHGTFVKSNDIVTKLVPNKPHTLMSEDLVTLGKSVNRDDRVGICVPRLSAVHTCTYFD